MSDPTQPLGARIEQILEGDDHYEKITQLVWIIQEHAYQALSTLAGKEE